MILSSLLPKATLTIGVIAASFFGGMLFQGKVMKPNITVQQPKVEFNHKCPDCNCPPTLGAELDKIKAKGRANLTIHLHQNYTTACSDSTGLRQFIDQSVSTALENYSVKKKR